MAKISPVAAKYIVYASIRIDGIVDKPDVIGAIFGQTEGLLGSDLELRELQRSGRIGRIEVNTTTSSGKTEGEIVIPSSLDRTETAIVAAALEVIQRIGPCNAKVEIKKMEDVRISKRHFVIERAKALLKELNDSALPDSQELADEVAQSVRVMEAVTYGPEKLDAGPAIEESDEIIIVEGRADVLNMLKNGFKNCIAMNGTSAPQSIKELSRKKNTVVFVDGDRGGELIVREMLSTADVDFVCKAPDGKEVEEITKKEIHKALRSRVTAEQVKLDLGIDDQGALKEESNGKTSSLREHRFMGGGRNNRDNRDNGRDNRDQRDNREENKGRFAPRNGQSSFGRPMNAPATPLANAVSAVASAPVAASPRDKKYTPEEAKVFKETLENLFGTRGACIFDQKLNILGKVPLSELSSTIKSLNGGIYALALDGPVDIDLLRSAEKLGINHLIATGSKVKEASRVNIITDEMLA
ncbi:DNA primase [Candidatus Woesearchaeota archaeon]|nr:DNA primase [Candidatus Woesearchaeota archaeon]